MTSTIPADLRKFATDTLMGEVSLDMWGNHSPTLMVVTRKGGVVEAVPFDIPEFASALGSGDLVASIAATYMLIVSTQGMPELVEKAIKSSDEVAAVVLFSEAYALKLKAKSPEDARRIQADIDANYPDGISTHPDVIDVKGAFLVFGRGENCGFTFERGGADIEEDPQGTGGLAIALTAMFETLKNAVWR